MEIFIDALGPGELAAYFGRTPPRAELRAERARCAQDRDYNCQRLFWLYLDRGQPDMAQACFDRIADPERRLEARILACECRN